MTELLCFIYFKLQSARRCNNLMFLFLVDMLFMYTCLAPPRLAFQLFAGQAIQLLHTKNKIVVVVVANGRFC